MKIGLIGCGRMGTALITGMAKSSLTSPAEISVYDPSPAAVANLVKTHGFTAAADNTALAAATECIIIAVKPQYVATALNEIRDTLTPGHLLLSVAAGVTLAKMESCCPPGTRIIRAMPNTPAMIGYGATGIAPGSHASGNDITTASKLLAATGTVCTTTDDQLNAVTGLSGSGPAYVYQFVASMAAQAEAEGLPPKDALNLATQTVLGAARMLIETGQPPQDLINQVTSPGGTTLAGLAALTANGFEKSVAAAVQAATKRSRELAKES